MGRTLRAGAVGLLMVLMLSACAGASPGSASSAGSPGTPTTQAGACQPSDEMGRPCASDAQAPAGAESEEEYGEYGGGYQSQLSKQCEHYLERSFNAYKACVRY